MIITSLNTIIKVFWFCEGFSMISELHQHDSSIVEGIGLMKYELLIF